MKMNNTTSAPFKHVLFMKSNEKSVGRWALKFKYKRFYTSTYTIYFFFFLCMLEGTCDHCEKRRTKHACDLRLTLFIQIRSTNCNFAIF